MVRCCFRCGCAWRIRLVSLGLGTLGEAHTKATVCRTAESGGSVLKEVIRANDELRASVVTLEAQIEIEKDRWRLLEAENERHAYEDAGYSKAEIAAHMRGGRR